MASMELPPLLKKVVDWLRAGYPEGVPDVDYIPLFALLGSELSNNDVELIADDLASSSDPQSAEAIRKAIAAVTNTRPGEADVNRVRARLAGELFRDGILVNSVCPGSTSGDGARGGAGRGSGRSVAQGAASVVWAVTLPNGGPTGTFTRDGRELPW